MKILWFKELNISLPGVFKVGGGGTPGLVGVLPGSPVIADPISGQKNVVFHTIFQTRPLKSVPIFRPGL